MSDKKKIAPLNHHTGMMSDVPHYADVYELILVLNSVLHRTDLWT